LSKILLSCQQHLSHCYHEAQRIANKYEAETTLAGELILSSATLLANEIFKLPPAKVVKQNLTLLKSVLNIPLSLNATRDILTRKAKNVNELVRNLASMSLLPFTFLEVYSFLATKVTVLKLTELTSLNNFFKAAPILGHVKYWGIPNVALITLLATFAFDSYKKGKKLRAEKAEMIQNGAPVELIKKHEIKIIQNNWSLAGKVVKVASCTFSLVVAVAGVAHPVLAAIKITLIVVDMGIALKKYHTKYLVPDDIDILIPEQTVLSDAELDLSEVA
jgi:hypothetical protein